MEFQRFHLAAYQTVQGAHIGSLAVLHGAHILYDQLGGDSAGGNQAVHQAALCHHIGKGFAVDFSHHLAVVQLTKHTLPE